MSAGDDGELGERGSPQRSRLSAGTDDSVYSSFGCVYLISSIFSFARPNDHRSVTVWCIRIKAYCHQHQHIRHHEGTQPAIEIERHSFLNLALDGGDHVAGITKYINLCFF